MPGLLRLVFRSLAARKGTFVLTALGVALGVMLISSVMALTRQVGQAYSRQGGGIPLVIGAKGSPLQLVLSAVYHLEQSPGLIPFSVLDELRGAPWVQLAVPYALGDLFQGYRVVATDEALFDASFQPVPGAPLSLASGRPFRVEAGSLRAVLREIEGEHPGEDHPEEGAPEGPLREAVLGAEVTRRLGLSPGDRIEPTHGVEGGKEHAHPELWTVVGTLAPTGTALDRVVFINLDSFFRIEEHRAGGRMEDGRAALSAVLVFPRTATARATMPPVLNRRKDLQVVSPGREIRRLLSLVGDMEVTLLSIAACTAVVGLLSVGLSICHTMAARGPELAVLRALGARRWQVLALLVGEALAQAVSGAILGLLLGRALLFVLQPRIEQGSGVALSLWRWTPLLVEPSSWGALPAEPLLVLSVGVLGAVVGLFPGLLAYRAPVADRLGRSS
jgi:putative ABC transport system permease protein